jgi:hypothetical protein
MKGNMFAMEGKLDTKHEHHDDMMKKHEVNGHMHHSKMYSEHKAGHKTHAEHVKAMCGGGYTK